MHWRGNGVEWSHRKHVGRGHKPLPYNWAGHSSSRPRPRSAQPAALQQGGSQIFPPQAVVCSDGVFVFVRSHVASRHSLHVFFPFCAVRGPMAGAISRLTTIEDAAAGVHAEGAAVGAWIGG